MSRDSSVHLIGMGWAGCDEAKFQRTFGCGRSIFGRFTDLQDIGAKMGYFQFGITSLSELLLNMNVGKSKRVSSLLCSRTLPKHLQSFASPGLPEKPSCSSA